MYAMINVEQYQTVATGSTVAECQEAYLDMMADAGVLGEDEAAAASDKRDVEGAVETIAQAVVDGNSHFYVTLVGDDAIYDFALPGMLEIVTYQPGDAISFTCTESDRVMTVTSLGERDEAGAPTDPDGPAIEGTAETPPQEGQEG